MSAFEPLIGKAPTTLILGSMPGQRSLIETQYYAHPQNSFWWIMSRLIGFCENQTYQERCESLTSSGFALWDVLFDCKRHGSLDSNIERESEQANDFTEFLLKLPTIQLIGFNGIAAKQIFMRHCCFLFDDFPKLNWCQLPSTSAAYASLSREEKLFTWQLELSENFNQLKQSA